MELGTKGKGEVLILLPENPIKKRELILIDWTLLIGDAVYSVIATWWAVSTDFFFSLFEGQCILIVETLCIDFL